MTAIPFASLNPNQPIRERCTQCPWCARWFKGQLGLTTHGRMNRGTCGWILSTALEADRRRQLEALRRNNEGAYTDALFGGLDPQEKAWLVRDFYKALLLAKQVSEYEFTAEAKVLALRMAHTGADPGTIRETLLRAGVPDGDVVAWLAYCENSQNG